MKRITIPAAAALLVAAAVSLPSATAHSAKARSFTLVEHEGALSAVDLPPVAASATAPPSRGDLVVFTKRLSGHRHGTLHAVCTVTRPRASIETSVFQCDATYALSDGRITAATAGPLSAPKVTLAITGGTGAYAGASGEIVAGETKDIVRLARR